MNALCKPFGASAAGAQPSRFIITPSSRPDASRYSDCQQGAVCTAALTVTRNRRQP